MNGIKDIRKIKISGGFFDTDITLDFFPEKFDKKEKKKIETNFSLIYGKNGSGKSSITNAIKEYKDIDVEIEKKYSLNFFDKNDNKIYIKKENIYVFNENFIDDNIKISSDGINAIVIFDKKTDEQIQNKEDKINIIIKNIDESEEDLSKMKKNIKKMEKDIKDNLREKWLIRKNYIQISKKLSPNIMDKILDIKCDEDINNLEKEFKKNISILNDIQTEKNNILIIKKIDVEENLDNIFLNILEKTFKKNKKMTKIEEKIMETIEAKHQNYIEEANEIFKNKKNCPFCFQELSSEYKNDLLNGIKNILNRDMQKEIEKINKMINYQLNIDMSFINIKIMNEDEKNDIKVLINELNNCLSNYKENLIKKRNNMFEKIVCENLNIMLMINEFNKKIDIINERINTHNIFLDKQTKIIEKLEKTNNEIAYLENKSLIEQYLKLENEIKKLESDKKNIENEKNKLENECYMLKEKQKNIQDSLDKINENLKYIFYDKNRLRLSVEDGKYIVYSRNKKVSPNNVSIGERNIIALCYFFGKIENNEESLFVIDDPISSVDFDNKFGIYSFLNGKISEILGNKNNKIILFTHEIDTMFNLQKIGSRQLQRFFNSFRLHNKEIVEFTTNKNEYKYLLNKIYEYAKNENNISNQEDDYIIGNCIRRVLECFLTFEYGIGINDVVYDEDILQKLREKNPKYKFHFEKLMYGILLNGESHFENRVYSLYDIDYDNLFSREEKTRICKEIISMMYLLNDIHIIKKLLDKNAKETIEKWVDEIIKDEKKEKLVEKNKNNLEKKQELAHS